MLVAITMMSIVGMKSAILQEKLSAGSMDQNIAFQAAESALRDAEEYIQKTLDASAGFNVNCNKGLCYPSTTSTSVWEGVSDWKTSNLPIVYGKKTGTSAIANVALQPRYLIEILPDLPASAGNSSKIGVGSSAISNTAFRITAVGWGQRSVTPIMLQSIYIK